MTGMYKWHGFCLFLMLAPAAQAEWISAEDFIEADPAQARLGQLLFYDPILSGNRNISCGTCHHHDHAGTDGLSLGLGEGGIGVGPERIAHDGADRIAERIPRNAPALWNLGHNSVRVLFHDGRLEISNLYGNQFDSPAEERLPQGLNNILAAQSLFPMTSQFEMAGNTGENDVIVALHTRIDRGWEVIADRIRETPDYEPHFVEAFGHIDDAADITIVEVANALGAFIASEWISIDSAFDAYMRDGTPLADDAERGRQLFFGEAGCAVCHSGELFTDQDFHALGLPAFGPGRIRKFDPLPRDLGRMSRTDLVQDAYRFRTPSLRNVALTAPYGHNGAYPTLEAMIRHHMNPEGARAAWDISEAVLPDMPWLAAEDTIIQQDRIEMARQAQALDIALPLLSEDEIAVLEAFLHALTGETVENRPLGRPETVPSGLPVD